MDVIIEQIETFGEALERLRSTPLSGAGEGIIYYYRNARLRIADMHPREVNPATKYLVRGRLEFQRELRGAILRRYPAIDTLKLPGVIHYRIDGGKLHKMAPPVVESHSELVDIIPRPGHVPLPKPLWLTISIFEDGMHRAWIANEINVELRCVLVFDAPSKEWPYYAYPNPWEMIQIYEEIPPEDLKKFHRRTGPERHAYAQPFYVLRDQSLPPELGRK